MIDIIKGLWKWILAILIFLILGIAVLAFRIFVIDKDYDGKASSSSKSSSSKFTDTVDSSESSSSFGQKIVNGAKAIGNATVKGYKEDEEYTYNVHNFDEAFLMYEGEQTEGAVKDVLEHLIENSKGTFYARTSVTAVNFGNGVNIIYDGSVEEYQKAIKNLENLVTDGKYDISFKYGGFGSYVNEIVITKK